MSVVNVQLKSEILELLIPEYIKITESVRNRLMELLYEELDTVLELATELDEHKITVNELRYVLSLRGINICF